MRVACNASPLIWLSHTGHFSLLQALFEVVLIPPEVWAETVERAMGYPNAEMVRAACETGWMVVVPPTDEARVTLLRTQLHAGEAEMLVMAEEPTFRTSKRQMTIFQRLDNLLDKTAEN